MEFLVLSSWLGWGTTNVVLYYFYKTITVGAIVSVLVPIVVTIGLLW